MKKKVLALCVSLMALLSAQAQTIVEDNFERLQVVFNVGELQTAKTVLDGRMFTRLLVDGMRPSAQVGAPELPTWSSIVEVPLCKDFEVEVSGMVYDTLTISGERIVPVQPSLSKSDTGRHPMTMDDKVYSTDAFFAASPLATVEAVGVARDRNLARLQFSPVMYNPVTGQVAVCRSATVTVRYVGADAGRSRELFERYYSPTFGAGNSVFNNLYPKAVSTTAPVRYLIVAHSMFRGQLDSFVQWKRRKGFITDIVYTDDAGVGTTSTAIQSYVRSQYTNATASNPAPTYLLIVGDHEQIPAFTGTTESDHITDLYYTTWTSGDNIPDCYCGRFSAQTVAQLTPQVEKTLMYEQYTFADPSFLDRAVMVAGVDGGSSGDNGYTYGDPAMDYAITNYVNGAHGFSQVMYFKNNTSIVPTGSNVTVGTSASSNSATVRGYYNQGAGWINYTAHGSATSWGTPSFTTSDAASMTNNQKFGIMIGNCCLTNKFETSTCLGESVLRKGNYCGAVGYIGGSNSTYWGEDFYWAVGVRSGIGPSMSMAYNSNNLGAYDRIFHTHNEARSAWVTTQGELMFQGNMAVQNSSSGRSLYYWEIYHLMGDPSLMPYLTQAAQMTLTASSVLMLGASTMTVTAAPYAYVALTDTTTRTLWASGFANASGQVTLTLPSGMPVGGYELAASAQQYRTAFRPVSVVPASGPYAVAVSVATTASLNAGSTVPLRIKVANLGNSNASGVTLALASDNPLVTLSTSTISLGSIAAGDTVTVTSVTATASAQAADATHAMVTATANWSGNTTPTTYGAQLTVNAAAVTMTVMPSSMSLLPDSTMTVTVRLVNNGHAALGTSQLTLTTGNPLMTVTGGQWTLGSSQLPAGGTLTRQCQIHAAASIDSNIFVPIYVHLGGAQTADDTLQIFIGENSTETFEGGMFQLQGWSQGSQPWTLTSGEAYEGSWSARSVEGLGSNGTSEISIAFTVGVADSVSFYYKVSSEANWDKFHCYLDNTDVLVASGEVPWTRAAFAVGTGSHQLRFTYDKDGSVDNGSDCAWLDNVSLPHGSHSTGSGSGDDGSEEELNEPGTFSNLIAGFESSADDSRWTIGNGSLCNGWFIGTAAANGSSRGLYISNDGGQTNAYTTNCSTSVFVYTTLWLDNGDYTSAFDWRCNGESTYDFLRAAILPASMTPVSIAGPVTGWTTTELPTGAIAIDGGQKLNQSTSWQTKVSDVHINQSGWYRLVFYWRNDYSVGNMPPAAIDNVMLVRAGDIHTLTVTATHGTTTGSGNYQSGEVATIGVYPEAGYTFVSWNDGNTANPRQLVVDETRTVVATLAQGSVTILHDTTYVNVPYAVHDTTIVNVPYAVHDTTIVNVPYAVHDTTVVYVPYTVHDTTIVNVPYAVHDTTVVTVTQTDTVVLVYNDTVTVSEYIEVPVHDTTYITEPDTVYIAQTDTVVLVYNDTVTVPEYIEVPVHDTTYITEPDTVYIAQTDTVVLVYNDTVLVPEYIEVPVHDTTIVTVVETDTVVVNVPYAVHDTTVVTVMQTDTVVLVYNDTVTVPEYIEVPVHDTTIITQTDTVVLTQTDTVVLVQTDTVTVPEYIEVPVYDTTYITQTDTVVLTQTDTVVLVQTDTVAVPEYIEVPVHDTTVVTFVDTTVVTDTLWLTQYDTVWLYDTVVIHDTIYLTEEGVDGVQAVNVKVYSSQGQIVVEGADGCMVTLYDVAGRTLAIRRDEYAPMRFDVPASGAYMIKVGDYPARKIVAVK